MATKAISTPCLRRSRILQVRLGRDVANPTELRVASGHSDAPATVTSPDVTGSGRVDEETQ
ncbi:hypothetical protein GCM10010404_34100 [Nonomuraea africana]